MFPHLFTTARSAVPVPVWLRYLAVTALLVLSASVLLDAGAGTVAMPLLLTR